MCHGRGDAAKLEEVKSAAEQAQVNVELRFWPRQADAAQRANAAKASAGQC